MSNNAKVTVTITEEGIDIVLENWEGVTNVMIETIHYAIVKKSQVFRAQKLGALHALQMKKDAEKDGRNTTVPAIEKKSIKSTVGDFFEELGNAIRT